ncbi:hypothetical protein CLU83_0984 [Flavobacterium sp. 1]|uniref:hypothetical protein n=1 Tax=Flavobacterium sp. 1 TaxID=2035200 RepID=UPI000C249B4F|nr:hypothetical protein [Flavobacterium sp. 1]PJJ07781.1 hypothetical protein CLU83_0984 [Flavobacterium sp. 1]
MENQLDELAKSIGKEIRKLLIEKGIFDNNIDVDFKIGKYTVLYGRTSSSVKKLEPFVNLPIDFFDILKNCVLEMEILWKEHEEEGVFGEDTTSEYYVECIIDDTIDLTGTVEELRTRIQTLRTSIEMHVRYEEYEEAGKLQKIIENIQVRINNEE